MTFLRGSSQFIKKYIPDFESIVLGDVAVIEGDMDTGDESVVEGVNAVSC